MEERKEMEIRKMEREKKKKGMEVVGRERERKKEEIAVKRHGNCM